MPDTPTHRLLDIIVEEVSLVDRAANKCRFLVVKRSDPTMTDTTQTSTEAQAPKGSDTTQTPQATVEETTTQAPLSDPLLVSAVTALEGLTSTVELLSSVGADDPRLTPLAEGLKTTAEELLVHAGAKPKPTEEASTQTNANTTQATTTQTSTAPVAPDAFTQSIAAARDALSQLSALTQKAEAPTSPEPTPAPTPQAPRTDEITSALNALTTSFKALSESVKEQQRRLALVEKNVGLPRSAQSPEAPARPAPEATAWPLDMNHPMDRESVDKAVSFHDL